MLGAAPAALKGRPAPLAGREKPPDPAAPSGALRGLAALLGGCSSMNGSCSGEPGDLEHALDGRGAGDDHQSNVLRGRASGEFERGVHSAGVDEREATEVEHHALRTARQRAGYGLTGGGCTAEVPLPGQLDRDRGALLTA